MTKNMTPLTEPTALRPRGGNFFCVVQYMFKQFSNQILSNDKNDHDDNVPDDGILFLAESHITCRSPAKIRHGQYKPVKPTYKLNVRVDYICESGYFRWGAASFRCTALPGTLKGFWREVCDDQFSDYSCRVGESTQCLPPAKYEEKCKASGGLVPRNSEIFCVKGRYSNCTLVVRLCPGGGRVLEMIKRGQKIPTPPPPPKKIFRALNG